MGALLRAFWGMIPISAIALPYALLGWPLLAARRRRRLPARYATATAGVDSAAFLVAFLVLCLVTMPVGTSGVSTLDLVPGADITAAALSAAFLARSEGRRIGMSHVLHASQRELSKHGVIVRPGDWGG